MNSIKKTIINLSAIIAFLIGSFFFFEPELRHDLPPANLLNKAVPSLRVYPIDHTIQFTGATSIFSLLKEKSSQYTILLQTRSETNEPTFVRQDVTLLFSNGFLVEKNYAWGEKVALVEQNIEIEGSGSTRYDTITFHHAEIHHEASKEITSQFAMSSDQVYILKSAFSNSNLFREAITNTQKQWQRILDQAITEQWQLQKQHLIQFYKIDPTKYHVIPFTELDHFNNFSFQGFTREETKRIVGAIWEAVYKYYILGNGKEGEPMIETIGSTVPTIFVSKNKDHLLFLFRTAKGKEVQIIQKLES